MRATALTDDGWAILALPHDESGRDLACAETWQRSLKRSANLDRPVPSGIAAVVLATEPYNRRWEQLDGSLYPEDEPQRVTAWNALSRGRQSVS